MRNHSNENEFDLHENKHASETNFHMNGFALRLVLKKRQKSTRKWPVASDIDNNVELPPSYSLWFCISLFSLYSFSEKSISYWN